VLATNLMLFSLLAAEPGGGRDAGAARDGARPRWVPTAKPIHLSEEANYGLRRSGDGYVHESPTFEAHVARDGVVTFKDKRTSVAGLFFPIGALKNLPRPKGPTLESTIRGHFDKRRRIPVPPETEPAPVPNQIDWEAVCRRGSNCDMRPDPTLLQVRGNFDLTDEIMRAYGQDPYARDKARFLSATFEFRMKLATEARKEDMKAALDHLPERLGELWADTRYSARERRRILYELWLETDATPQGERAARVIIDFVRGHLPCGAADGYSAQELAGFRTGHPERRFPPAEDCLPARAP
jgi:hypothetical protein